jgi:hypothetical protein
MAKGRGNAVLLSLCRNLAIAVPHSDIKTTPEYVERLLTLL